MAKKLWGGRFSKEANPQMEKFTKSIDYDYKLAAYDTVGSICHVRVLKKAKLITAKEARKMEAGLESILSTVIKGALKIDKESEDIHSAIQSALEKKIGKLALKLHTARSRNEQVVFDVKLYCLQNIHKTVKLNDELFKALFARALREDIIMPGFTHMQHAEPLSLEHYLAAYMRMLRRDNKRFVSIVDSIDLTLGAGALAGTAIKASAYNIKGLPFGKKLKPTENSVDAVSDRDFILDTLNALSILGMHLSRIAEDFILWSTKEFGFIELDDAFCTGSSLMPQKKNPDALELIRGYASKLCSNYVSVSMMLKGLPLSYNRDMQLDKEPLFNSFEIVQDELIVLREIVASMKFNKDRIDEQLEDESLYATTLAHYLVTKGIGSKEAHAVIGRLIKYSEMTLRKIKEMNNVELKQFSKFLDRYTIIKLMNPHTSLKLKRSVRK